MLAIQHMHRFVIKHNSKLSKVTQIARSIARDIEKDLLKKDFQLPSINDFSEQYAVARDTVEKAYKELKKEGYITSVAAKGYFVVGKKEDKLKILLIFNKISSYKKIIYDSFLETLGEKARVDLQIHHYSPRLLKEIIDNNLGDYHYYVIMPHFLPDSDKAECLQIMQMIPPDELVLLDKDFPALEKKCMAVYQDFKEDIYNALQSVSDLLEKYERLTIIFPEYSNHPTEIIEGTLQFCTRQRKKFSVVPDFDEKTFIAGTAYIVIAESDLSRLIKKVRASEHQLGKDIGIISFNETVLKELLDITVITTDFDAMGRTAASLILNKQYIRVKNPFQVIKRQSL